MVSKTVDNKRLFDVVKEEVGKKYDKKFSDEEFAGLFHKMFVDWLKTGKVNIITKPIVDYVNL